MIDRAGAWQRLPEELKSRPQWAVAGASKAPLSVRDDGKLFHTSVTRPSEWLTFDEACELALAHWNLVTTHTDKQGRVVTQVGLDIGFILNESDPLTCVDLDIKDATTHPDEPALWTPPERFDFYWNIVQHFKCYTERSRSGKGLHIWALGNIGRGFKRDGVEVYSQERFIISTGDAIMFEPVHDRQMLLTNMVSQMRPAPKEYVLEEFDPDEDDWSILERAIHAGNSDKFTTLWKGDWHSLGFPSQSEADLALMSMFTFYSESNEQCRRLFRDSGLGKREKAIKDNRYLDFTLTTIRQRQARERSADISAVVQAAQTQQELALAEIQRLQHGAAPQGYQIETGFGPVPQRTVTSLHVTGQGDPTQAPPPPEIAAAALAPVSAEVVAAGETGLPWPPGFAGHLARFIYRSAPRPVKEVAIVAALGLLAGITGKAWHIPQSGLNLYIILIARSAVGKEAMHTGISAIIKACTQQNPFFGKFIDFTEYASGPALIKACATNPSFVNVSGEWGRRLKRLANDERGDGPLQTLRTQMTNLYQKSGPTSIVGGIGYSTQDNNIASVAGVSYSMIGETTPGTFYEALTETMMEDGFLSRFLIIEYDGLRPDPNDNAVTTPDDAMVTALNNMAIHATGLIDHAQSQPIGRDEASATLMKAFEVECDNQINSTNDESRRQMWNRAALKSLRIAGLLAVADNYATPCIRREHIEWAQDVVMRDIAIMKKRLDGGDVGSGDNSRERKLVSVLKDYLVKPVPDSYKVPDAMRQNSIVPRNYMQVRIGRAAAFYNHRLGANKALSDTIESLVANGYLMEVQKDKVIEAYGFHGKAYRVVKLPDYDAQSKD